MIRQRKRRIDASRLDENFIPVLLGLPMIVLHEEYGWGSAKRLPEFMESMTLRLKAIESGEVKVSDVIEQLETLTGAKIE